MARRAPIQRRSERKDRSAPPSEFRVSHIGRSRANHATRMESQPIQTTQPLSGSPLRTPFAANHLAIAQLDTPDSSVSAEIDMTDSRLVKSSRAADVVMVGEIAPSITMSPASNSGASETSGVSTATAGAISQTARGFVGALAKSARGRTLSVLLDQRAPFPDDYCKRCIHGQPS
jgi:hypothetical protein